MRVARTQGQLRNFVDEMLESSARMSILLHRPFPLPSDVPTRSKIGGRPQLPADLEWPEGRYEGKSVPLHFLAQVDCAELPKIGSLLPEFGVLFFFALQSEEQIWDEGEPGDRVRVLYAPHVPVETLLREAPVTLPPIFGGELDLRDSWPYWPDWSLPGDALPKLHMSWPLVAYQCRSFGGYFPHDCVTREEALAGDCDVAFARRVNECNAGAVVAAAGIPTRSRMPPHWEDFGADGWSFPGKWSGEVLEPLLKSEWVVLPQLCIEIRSRDDGQGV